MTHGRDGEACLEARVLRLESALRRAKLILAGLATALAILVLVAWRGDDEIRARRLVLTSDLDTAVLVLRAVSPAGGPGLILETPGGRAIMTLGGDAVRPVRR